MLKNPAVLGLATVPEIVNHRFLKKKYYIDCITLNIHISRGF
jgi:hypothetical protein